MAVLLCVCALLAASCGGGGGRSAALPTTSQTGSYAPEAGVPLSSKATRYGPKLSKWHLYNATAQWNWTSAIGSTPGLTASMSNPFTEVAIALIPTNTYNNPGKVTFYIDGVESGSLDLSQEVPFEGYEDSRVNYYVIAKDLTDAIHTVTMEIATGTVAFDGWRILHRKSYTIIDCSEANTTELDSIASAAALREGIEAYYEKNREYPDPDSDLGSFLVSYDYLDHVPNNPYLNDEMAELATDTFSAGNYRYERISEDEYRLSIDGGKGTLVTLTQNSVESDFFTLQLDTPANHLHTNQAYVDISGTVTTLNEGNMEICCGLSGEVSFPVAAGSFTKRIMLKEGVNELGIRLFDPYDNEVTVSLTITKDTTAPQVELLSPAPLTGPVGSQLVNVATNTVTVEILAEASATVTINGATVAESEIAAGVFSTIVTLGAGSNTIRVTAADVLGNTRTKEFNVVYTPPQAAREPRRKYAID